MEVYIKLAAQILFGLGTLFFVVYSIVGMYTLNTYSKSKTVASTVSMVYGAAVIGLLSWGFTVILNIQ